MSTVVIIAPIIVTSWPMITAAVAAAAASAGFAVAKDVSIASKTSVKMREEFEVENSEILAGNATSDQEIVIEKDRLRATFKRDRRGSLHVCMEGVGYSKKQLREMGEELLGRVTQQYAYHRLVTEMKERDMVVVDEEVQEDQSIKIRVRNW